MKSFKDIVEINSQTAVFAFGRFNPPTAGHLKLAMKVKQVAGSDDGFIYTSHSQDPKKNPLDYRTKTKFMKLLFRPAKVTVSTSILFVLCVSSDTVKVSVVFLKKYKSS